MREKVYKKGVCIFITCKLGLKSTKSILLCLIGAFLVEQYHFLFFRNLYKVSEISLGVLEASWLGCWMSGWMAERLAFWWAVWQNTWMASGLARQVDDRLGSWMVGWSDFILVCWLTYWISNNDGYSCLLIFWITGWLFYCQFFPLFRSHTSSHENE